MPSCVPSKRAVVGDKGLRDDDEIDDREGKKGWGMNNIREEDLDVMLRLKDGIVRPLSSATAQTGIVCRMGKFGIEMLVNGSQRNKIVHEEPEKRRLRLLKV